MYVMCVHVYACGMCVACMCVCEYMYVHVWCVCGVCAYVMCGMCVACVFL